MNGYVLTVRRQRRHGVPTLPEGPPEDWETFPGQFPTGDITQLHVEGGRKKKKHPLGFYEHQTKRPEKKG